VPLCPELAEKLNPSLEYLFGPNQSWKDAISYAVVCLPLVVFDDEAFSVVMPVVQIGEMVVGMGQVWVGVNMNMQCVFV
jgi:hypothetical protein